MKFNIDHDYHIHSNISLCSNDKEQTPERILQYAKQNNFREICLTDHFWDETINGASEWYEKQNFEHISAALPLPQCDGVEFYFGCETELNKDMTLGISEKTMEKMDFIIIPTNHLHMIGYTIDKNMKSVEERAEIYINRTDKLLDMDLPFEKIGIAHLTCQLMAYNWNSDWDEHIRIIDKISTEVYKELFQKISKKGAGVELNFPIAKYSSEERERVLRPYRIAKDVGCKFYLGSDAHATAELDGAKKNFEEIVLALKLEEKDKFSFKK